MGSRPMNGGDVPIWHFPLCLLEYYLPTSCSIRINWNHCRHHYLQSVSRTLRELENTGRYAGGKIIMVPAECSFMRLFLLSLSTVNHTFLVESLKQIIRGNWHHFSTQVDFPAHSQRTSTQSQKYRQMKGCYLCIVPIFACIYGATDHFTAWIPMNITNNTVDMTINFIIE